MLIYFFLYVVLWVTLFLLRISTLNYSQYLHIFFALLFCKIKLYFLISSVFWRKEIFLQIQIYNLQYSFYPIYCKSRRLDQLYTPLEVIYSIKINLFLFISLYLIDFLLDFFFPALMDLSEKDTFTTPDCKR